MSGEETDRSTPSTSVESSRGGSAEHLFHARRRREHHHRHQHHQMQERGCEEKAGPTENERKCDGDGDTSFVKTLLRNYQQSAERSLDGPPMSMLTMPPFASHLGFTSSLEPYRKFVGGCGADVETTRWTTHGTKLNQASAASRSSVTPISERCTDSRRGCADNQLPVKRRRSAMTSSSNGVASSTSDSSLYRLPFLLQADRTSDSTVVDVSLKGEPIASFAIGGEPRLCLPQVLRSVLGGQRATVTDQQTPAFSLAQINTACDRLQIHCAASSPVQLGSFRRRGVLPPSAATCGLITLSDAHRLCNALLRGGSESEDHVGGRHAVHHNYVGGYRREGGIPVVHRCFGKCSGLLRISSMNDRGRLDDETGTVVVVCDECRRTLDVEQFVGHSHVSDKTKTCHWGFDAANWMYYVQLNEPVRASDAEIESLQCRLDKVKAAALTGRWSSSLNESSTKYRKVLDERTGSDLPSTSTPVVTVAEPDKQRSSVSEVSMSTAARLDKESALKRVVDGGMHALHEPSYADKEDETVLKDIDRRLRKTNGETWSHSVQEPSLMTSVISILKAEIDLFSSALHDVTIAGSRHDNRRRRFLVEFAALQRKHVEMVDTALASQELLKREVNDLRSALAKGVVSSKQMEIMHVRQLDSIRREDESKLREAQRENDQLRLELDALIGGVKRSDIGLVKAKYKARAKHFERKLQQTEEANSRLINELASIRHALMVAAPRLHQGSHRSQHHHLRHYHQRADWPTAADARPFRDVVTDADDADRASGADHVGDVVVPRGSSAPSAMVASLSTPLSPPSSHGEPSPRTIV